MPLSPEELQEIGHYMTAVQAHAKALGMRLVSVEHDRAVVELPWREDLVGDPETGVLAGGVVTTLMDNVCGLTMTTATGRVVGATLDLRVDYMRRSAPRSGIFCEARCSTLTRSVAFLRAEVWDHDRDDLVALAQGAFALSRK